MPANNNKFESAPLAPEPIEHIYFSQISLDYYEFFKKMERKGQDLSLEFRFNIMDIPYTLEIFKEENNSIRIEITNEHFNRTLRRDSISIEEMDNFFINNISNEDFVSIKIGDFIIYQRDYDTEDLIFNRKYFGVTIPDNSKVIDKYIELFSKELETDPNCKLYIEYNLPKDIYKNKVEFYRIENGNIVTKCTNSINREIRGIEGPLSSLAVQINTNVYFETSLYILSHDNKVLHEKNFHYEDPENFEYCHETIRNFLEFFMKIEKFDKNIILDIRYGDKYLHSMVVTKLDDNKMRIKITNEYLSKNIYESFSELNVGEIWEFILENITCPKIVLIKYNDNTIVSCDLSEFKIKFNGSTKDPEISLRYLQKFFNLLEENKNVKIRFDTWSTDHLCKKFIECSFNENKFELDYVEGYICYKEKFSTQDELTEKILFYLWPERKIFIELDNIIIDKYIYPGWDF